MANNYTSFSFVIQDLNKDQVLWLSKKLSLGDEDYGEHRYSLNEPLDITIYSEECADLEKLSELLQEFLKHFNLDRLIGFEYACTCSKPRVGEFGGGGILVSKDNIEIKTTSDILEEMCQKNENYKRAHNLV